MKKLILIFISILSLNIYAENFTNIGIADMEENIDEDFYKIKEIKSLTFEEIKERLIKLCAKRGYKYNFKEINKKNIDEILNKIYEYHNENLAYLYLDYAKYLINEKQPNLAFKSLQKGESLNIRNKEYYPNIAQMYYNLKLVYPVRKSLKKYMILRLLDKKQNGIKFEELPKLVYYYLSEKEIEMYSNHLDMDILPTEYKSEIDYDFEYKYKYDQSDYEALKLLIEYKFDNEISEDKGIYYFSYKEGSISLFEALKLLKNPILMKYYKKYQEKEFERINKKNKKSVYSNKNNSSSPEKIMRNAEVIYNLLNFEEVLAYLNENKINKLTLNYNEFFKYFENFYYNYALSLFDRDKIDEGLKQLEIAERREKPKKVIFTEFLEENALPINNFYLKIASLYEKYGYSKGLNRILKKYLLMKTCKPPYLFSIESKIIENNLSKEEIEAFSKDKFYIYSKKIKNKYMYSKKDKEVIKFLINLMANTDLDLDGDIQYFIDDVEGTMKQFLQEYGDKELIDYYNEKEIEEDYSDFKETFALDRILKRIENIYKNSEPKEILEFLDKKIDGKKLIDYYNRWRFFENNKISKRIKNIYINFSDKEKIEFLSKLKIDALIEEELKYQRCRIPLSSNKQLAELCLDYATNLMETKNIEKAISILDKITPIYNSSDQDYYLRAAKLYKKGGKIEQTKKMLKRYVLLDRRLDRNSKISKKDIKNLSWEKIVTDNLTKSEIYTFGGNSISIFTTKTREKDYIKQTDYDILTLIIDYKNLFKDYTFKFNDKKVTLNEILVLLDNIELKKYYDKVTYENYNKN